MVIVTVGMSTSVQSEPFVPKCTAHNSGERKVHFVHLGLATSSLAMNCAPDALRKTDAYATGPTDDASAAH